MVARASSAGSYAADGPVVAVVPMRAGSRGLPGKNLRPLAGKPLYRHSVDHALDAGVDRVVVTTDLDLGVIDDPRVIVHARPPDLAADDTPMDPVLVDVVQRREFDRATVVLLQPTSPLRRPVDIEAALRVFAAASTSDLVMSVCVADSGVLKWGTIEDGRLRPMRQKADLFTNRQALPAVHRPNGAVYVFDAEWFRRNRRLSAATSVRPYEMTEADSVDIDDLADFERCETLLQERIGSHT